MQLNLLQGIRWSSPSMPIRQEESLTLRVAARARQNSILPLRWLLHNCTLDAVIGLCPVLATGLVRACTQVRLGVHTPAPAWRQPLHWTLNQSNACHKDKRGI